MSAPGFKITDAKGFHVAFANGHTVSVQFGYGNYCSNRDRRSQPGEDRASGTAEVAIWNAAGDWIRLPDWTDDVHGWQTPAQVLEIMQVVAAMPATGGAA